MQAQAANITWSGATDQLWQIPTNWVGGVTPTVADRAIINATPNQPIIDNVAVTSLSTSVGDTGIGTLDIQNGGNLYSPSFIQIGSDAGGVGTLTLTGAGSQARTDNSIRAGNLGTGTLIVSDQALATAGTVLFVGFSAGMLGTLDINTGGQTQSTSHTIIGSDAGAIGNATVDGTGSLMNSGGQIVVGNNGTGTLTVRNNSSATSGNSVIVGGSNGSNGTLNIQSNGKVTGTTNTILGNASGATGAVNITGSGSELISLAELRVGNGGSGTLNITNGGQARSTGLVYVALNAGSTGNATIDGTGSLLSTNNQLVIASSGTGSLTVRNNASASSASNVVVGNGNGSNGTLNIESGGTVTSTSTAQIGNGAGSTATANITGTNSKLTSLSELRVGNAGSGTLNITNGAQTNITNRIYIGVNAAAVGNITIDGTGSFLQGAEELRVGESGTGNLIITNGGSASITNQAYVGRLVGSNGTLVLDGADSSFSAFQLRIADNGTGVGTVRNSATVNTSNALIVGGSGGGNLNIQTGGQVTVGNNIAYIGRFGGSTGTVTVDGSGSRLISQTELRLGDEGTGNLTITNSGAVSVEDIFYIGTSAGSSGNLNVNSGGQAEGTSQIVIGAAAGSNGTAIVDGMGSLLSTQTQLVIGHRGTGTLTLRNDGNLNTGLRIILANDVGSTGTLNIGAASGNPAAAAGTVDASSIEFGSGTGELVLNHTDVNYDLDSAISGTGTIRALAGTSTLSGNSSGFDGDLEIDAGTLVLSGLNGASTANVINGGVLGFNHGLNDYDFAGDFTGDGTLRFLSGRTTLSGDGSAFTGNFDLAGGSLYANGNYNALAATANAGERIGGSGTLGAVTLNNGGIASPGNSIGTLNVATATFNPGSIYEVELNSAGQSDLLNATGAVTINGGTVQVVPFPDFLTGSPYTIITAAGGVGGTFDDLDLPAYLTGLLGYNANNVFLTLTAAPGYAINTANTQNQLVTAQGAEAATFTGINSPALNALADATLVSATASQQALDALSGEIHAGIVGAQLREASSLSEIALGKQPRDQVERGKDTMYVTALGSRRAMDRQSSLGSASFRDRIAGVVVGIERAIKHGHLGAAVGFSNGKIDMDARRSNADSANYHVMAYGGRELDEGGFRLDGGASWTYSKVDVSRDVTFTGFSSDSDSEYDTHTGQLFAKLSYPFDFDFGRISPYGHARYIHYRSESFRENGDAALQSGQAVYNRASTGLGVDISAPVYEQNDYTLQATGGLRWEHAVGEDNVERTLFFAGAEGSDFAVGSTPLARDSATISAGLSFTNKQKDLDLSLAYTGNFAKDERAQGLTLKAQFKF